MLPPGAVAGGAGTAGGSLSAMLSLERGALPRLREVNASRDIITAIMKCRCVGEGDDNGEECPDEKTKMTILMPMMMMMTMVEPIIEFTLH